MPLAPALFSTMKFCPSFCCSRSATSRAMVSGVAPAPNGTMKRTVLVGQSCASAGAAALNKNSARATMRVTSSSRAIRAAYVRRRLPRSSECGPLPQHKESAMGLAIMILGLAVFIGTHLVTTQRDTRATLIARYGEGPYKGRLFARLGRRRGADRLGFRRLPRRRLDRRVVSAGLDAARHGPAGLARHHFLLRGLFARPHQDRAQAPDAGRHQAVGGRAPHLQRRPRLDHPVRRRSSAGQCSTASRSSAAPIRAGSRFRLAACARTSWRSLSARWSIWRLASCSTLTWLACRRSANSAGCGPRPGRVNHARPRRLLLPCARHIASLPADMRGRGAVPSEPLESLPGDR